MRPGGIPGCICLPLPPGYVHPCTPWVYASLCTPWVHPAYTIMLQQHAGCIGQPAWVGGRALGSRREKALGRRSSELPRAQKCLASCARARRIACSARARLDKDRIAQGGFKAQGALKQ